MKGLLGSSTIGRRKEKKSHNNQRRQKLREKLISGKITEPHTNPLFVREITGEKKRILTATLYNSTHNNIIY